MAGRKLHTTKSVIAGRGASAPKDLMAELCQPLTAALNYVGAARMIIRAGRDYDADAAVLNLDQAGEQILRAGEIVRRLQHLIECPLSD